jgi:transcriptional regulator GlxA family with amidase domain
MMRQSLATRLSIKTVSASVNLSPRRLGQLFKQETGMSPSRYLKTLRMARAEFLLRTSFLTIKEVTFQSGMTDVSHFVRDFKKRHRMTPTEFRRRIGQSSKDAF